MPAAVATRPPGPKGIPLIGSLREFRGDPPGFLLRIAREYGEIVHFTAGGQRIFLIDQPEWIKDVFVTHQSNFKKSRMLERARTLLGDGLLTSEGEFHKRQRRLVQPAFHRDRLIGYAASMVEYGARHREHWQNGAALDVDQEMMRLTLAIVGKTLFSADIEKDTSEIATSLGTLMEVFNFMLLPFSEYLEKTPLPITRRFNKARAALDDVVYRLIRERRASNIDQGDLLSMLLLAVDEGDGTGMTDAQVRDEALTLILAGHETTANALTWTWYLLSQHPEVEQRMHEEIDRVLGDRLPAFDDFPRLPYTESVFAESMRLYPPAWAIGRRAKADYEIAGYTIPAQSILILSPYVTHRNSKWWPAPERFDPSRWTPEARDSRPKFAYFPFGGGARVCIGERFAWLEGVLLLATIAQRWRFRLVPGHPVAHQALITLRTRHGMKMIAERR
jgi:cytochrome P450